MIAKKITFTVLCLMQYPLLMLASGQLQQQQTLGLADDQENIEEYLNTLSIEELEEICTSRGFQLQPEDGFSKDEYTQEDYIDAALQCLAIEAEIEAAIEENPELLDQLKNEAERMQAEKEELEAELLRLLKEQSEERNNTDSDQLHHAFIGDDVISNGSDSDDIDSAADDFETDEQPKNEESSNSNFSSSSTATADDKANIATKDVEPITSSHPMSQPSNIITTHEFLMEFKNQIVQDLNKVMVFVEPIAAPLVKVMRATFMSVYLSITDMIKRYSSSITSNFSQDKDKKPETCSSTQTTAADDAVAVE